MTWILLDPTPVRKQAMRGEAGDLRREGSTGSALLAWAHCGTVEQAAEAFPLEADYHQLGEGLHL